jgi:hypothetical protein
VYQWPSLLRRKVFEALAGSCLKTEIQVFIAKPEMYPGPSIFIRMDGQAGQGG